MSGSRRQPEVAVTAPVAMATPSHDHAAPYSLRQIEKMLGLSRQVIAGLINAGFVTPQRGPRNALRFSFQDVVLLRTAHQLREANLPPRRLSRSLKQLRAKLPDQIPLSGLRIKVIGNDVAVRDAQAQWEDPTGQLLMDFEMSATGACSVAEIGGAKAQAKTIAAEAAPTGGAPKQSVDPASLYRLAQEHESEGDSGAAENSYRQLLSLLPDHVDAAVNLSAMLCEAGRSAEALEVCDQAIMRGGEKIALLHFNRAIALEDQDCAELALHAYTRCLQLEPDLADAHYNIARLHEQQGRKQEALRHYSAYRRLSL